MVMMRISRGWLEEVDGRAVTRKPVAARGGTWPEARPIGIIFHYTAGCGSDLSGVFTDRGVSAHFSVDRDGKIYQYVPLGKIAWHADNANSYYVGLEHTALPGRCDLTEPQLQASAALSAAIVQWAWQRRGVEIPLRKIQGPDLVPGFHDHADGDGTVWNISGHTDKLYLWSWDRYLSEVAQHLGVVYLWQRKRYRLRELLRALRERLSKMRPGEVLRLRIRARRGS